MTTTRSVSRTMCATLTFCVVLGCLHVPGGWSRADAADTPAQTATTEDAVRSTLQRYAAALQSLNAAAVKKIQPSIPADTLTKAFKEMRELKVTIDDVRVISSERSTARVSCRVTQVLIPKAGTKQTTAVTRVMRLRRDGDEWVIDGFER